MQVKGAFFCIACTIYNAKKRKNGLHKGDLNNKIACKPCVYTLFLWIYLLFLIGSYFTSSKTTLTDQILDRIIKFSLQTIKIKYITLNYE